MRTRLSTSEFIALDPAAGKLWQDTRVAGVALLENDAKPFRTRAAFEHWLFSDQLAARYWERPAPNPTERATALVVKLVDEHGLNPTEASRRLGISRAIYYRVVAAARERGRCRCCGQMLPEGVSVLD